MKKRILSVLLAAFMLISLLPMGALAADEVASGTCGAKLTWTLDSDGALTISGTGEMDDYSSDLSAPWEEYCSLIKRAVISNGVTSIGYAAFWGCCSLTSIEIPDSVTCIDDYAFYYCSSLKSVTIPASVTSIGNYAFISCSSLTDINVLDDNAKYSSIDGVLLNKEKSELICYPAGKTGSEYVIPDSVTSIGSDAFLSCSGLTSIEIPDSVTSIGDCAFSSCSGLTSIEIPDSVRSIGDGAFLSCSGLTSIEIPNSVTSIGDYAFSYCGILTSVTIPDSVTSIGRGAFDGCSNLTNITIPDTVVSIGEWAFRDCSSLTNIKIPNSVTIIGDSAFFGCRCLESIAIPDSVTSIGRYAFEGCSELKDVYYGGTEAQWKAVVMGDGNEALKSAAVHYGSGCSFTDVDVDGKHAPFADAIQWAADEGITTGYGNGIFKPDKDCTRAQVVTFLWRAAGEPAPKSTDNPFVDVSAKQADGKDNPFYTAILWAVGEGITLGYDDTHFVPDKSVSRAQFVTFLWRYENKPEAKPGMTLTDLDTVTNADFKAAILWAAGEEITTGYDDGSFRPNTVCTRAHVVTFLYRDVT